MKNTKGQPYFILLTALVIVVLIYGQHLLIPFFLSLIFWFLIREVRNLYRKVPFIEKKFPTWLQNTLATVLIFFIAAICVQLLTKNIQSLSQSLEIYNQNLNHIAGKVNTRFGIDIKSLLSDYSGKLDFSGILSNVFTSLTNIFGNAFTILLYTLFLLLEESIFSKKLKALYSNPDQFENVNSIILKIDKSISNYLTLKTIVSLMTGLLSYLALLIIGVESPFFWSFLIFLLNFIPTIGSLIATVFPAIFSLLQFGEFQPALYVLIIVGLIQVLVGNIIEPKMMGNTLNISSLVVLLSLSFWGAIWGITGMILCVPITVISVIICSEFPSTRPIAILLSEKGKI
ncbi:MAG: AI-2E family transporter [Cyclobacteriaceae bacterium]|nr:AI-2E family transporter [Cyclobacteriaceae bacterium]